MGILGVIEINWRSALMFAICIPMVMTSIMLLLRQNERRANIFFAAFLIAVVTVQIPQIIGFSSFYRIWPGLTFAPFDTELYLGPLLYLHAWSLMNDKPLGWRWGLLVPGMVQSLYYTWAFLALGDYKSKWAYTAKLHDPYIVPIETLSAIVLVVGGCVGVYILIKRYTEFLAETQSTKTEFDPVWLKQLLGSFALAGVIFIASQIVSVFSGNEKYIEVFPLQLFLTAIISWLGMGALSRTSHAFPKLYNSSRNPGPVSVTKPRDWVADGNALKSAIINGSWFLVSSLSLRDLAQRMNSNETYMSQTINLGLNTNFNTLINTMRVEHAKALLVSTRDSVLQVALDSGFNSKPTFNRVFREISGMTPSHYRKSNAQLKTE